MILCFKGWNRDAWERFGDIVQTRAWRPPGRTTITLPDVARSIDVNVELMALENLVAAKRTQRDKDWPMLRRLVDASYDSARDSEVSDAQVAFWFSKLRSVEYLREAVERFAEHAARCARRAVLAALANGDVSGELASEQSIEMAADRAYWQPLRHELEQLRHAARRAF